MRGFKAQGSVCDVSAATTRRAITAAESKPRPSGPGKDGGGRRPTRRSEPTLPQLTPVSRETVQERVYGELREALMRGRFVPGAPVTLRALASALGTSAMPIRAALRQLVAEQALIARPNRTVIVPLVTAARFDEIRRIRVALEGMLAEEAAAKIDKPTIQRLTESHDSMNAAVANNDVRRYLAQNQEFHFAIYRAAALPNALRMVENLWLQVGPLLNFLLASRDSRPSTYFNRRNGAFQKHHRATLDALRRGDAARARRGITDDINEAADVLLATAHFAAPDEGGGPNGARP
jgi:DNA-binding GntR family transcriptional regulator